MTKCVRDLTGSERLKLNRNSLSIARNERSAVFGGSRGRGGLEILEGRRLLASDKLESLLPTTHGSAGCPCGCSGFASAVVAEPVEMTVRKLTQANPLFARLGSLPQVNVEATRTVQPAKGTAFSVNWTNLRATLDRAPTESASEAVRQSNMVVSLPAPNGQFQRFALVETSIMEPGLAEKMPEFRSYMGQGIDDPTATLALTDSTLGLHASVLTPNGSWYIDPYVHLETDTHVSYYRNDLQMTEAHASWQCHVEPDAKSVTELPESTAESTAELTGATRRVYRAAVSATGEYTSFHGGATGALNAIGVSIARLNQVYERDFNVRFLLVANNNLIVYTNATTDPFSGSASTMLGQNQAAIDGAIGNANYDIGHVYHRADLGGIAALGSVGVTGSKAQGVSTLGSPTGDPFNIDYVAHEVGHQFNGRHTFNSVGGGAGDSTTLAIEVGAGSTIMAYAGLGNSNENTQLNSDAMFSAINYRNAAGTAQQMLQFTTQTNSIGFTSAVKEATGNNDPTITALPASYNIPISTPFRLTANASDANGDTLTYSWEQMDGGTAVALTNITTAPSRNAVPVSTATAGPMFRAKLPANSPTRLFPELDAIQRGRDYATGERLPSVARAMNFTVVVRDNRAGAGGTALARTAVNTVSGSSAFAITNFNAIQSLAGGSNITLNWSVGNTNVAPISAANVNIRMSTDSGVTFSTVLASNVPNDGSEVVTLPNVTVGQVRFMVEPTNNIFFDINNANLSIIAQNSVVPIAPTLAALSDTGVSNSDGITRLNNSTVSDVLQFNVGNTVSGALVELLLGTTVVGSATATGTSTVVTTNGSVTFANGPVTLTARQTEPTKNPSTGPGLTFTVDSVAPAAPGSLAILAADDSGISSADGITKINTLRFVGSAEVGSTTTARINSNILGTAASTGSFQTSTSSVIADGSYIVSVESTDVAGNVSSAGTLSITIDTVAPVLSGFLYEREQVQDVGFQTSESLAGTLLPSSISVINTIGGASVPLEALSLDGSTYVVSFVGLLPDGRFTLSVNTAGVSDLAGNSPGSASFNFKQFAGDTDGDDVVGFNDLLAIARNYNTPNPNPTFSEGDLDYDNLVNFSDLLILARAYGSTLPLPRPAISPVTPFRSGAAIGTVTSTVPARSAREDVLSESV